MKITIINIANKMPTWVNDACIEYLKRINHGKYTCKIIEIKTEKHRNKPLLENMLLEAKRIKAQIPTDSFIIVLDERGIRLNSIQFANKLTEFALHNSSFSFIIGGADGIHPDLRKEANLVLQLSDLTFPHAIVRILILEQIYRAITILENHPYHRE